MSNLLKPLNTKNISLINRLIMPPMATSKSEEDGRISKEILEYYNEKSHGGYISLIIIEHSYVMEQGKASKNQLSIADDKFVDDLKKLSEVIHKNGSKAIMQINHAGSSTSKEITGYEIYSASNLPNPRRNKDIIPLKLTTEEIKEIVDCFTKAAVRVKNAGFDGVEIHAAHGYLLHQFFSPLTNNRNDEYGGDILGRIKIHLEIIKSVRKAVGESFPIFIRFGARDYMEGGVTIEDSMKAAVEFEKAGVDIIDISGGFSGYIIPDFNVQGYFSPLTEAIKHVVSIPVILTGGVTEPIAAEKLLSENKADLIGVGRAILSDSGWAKNAMAKLI